MTDAKTHLTVGIFDSLRIGDLLSTGIVCTSVWGGMGHLCE